MGNMNIDIKNKYNTQTIKYIDILSTAGFREVIKEYTREEIRSKNLSQSCIDHIYYKGSNLTTEGFVINVAIADHYLTGMKINNFTNTNVRK